MDKFHFSVLLEADKKVRGWNTYGRSDQQAEEEEGHSISTCIENLRPTCASCNGDMRTFNLFSFIDVVGDFMTAEMEKWTRWFRGL